MCRCSYTQESDGICDGTHKIINAFKKQVVQMLEEKELFDAAELVKKL